MSRRQPGSLVPLEPRLSPGRARLAAAAGSPAETAGRSLPLLIVDPLALFRRGLALMVTQWYPGASVYDGADIASVLGDQPGRARPELVLIDALLACRWNFAGLGQLTTRLPATPVVLLSDELDLHLARGAIRAGARGFIAKSASEDTLRRAVALAISGEIFLPRDHVVDRDSLGAAPDDPAPGTLSDAPLRRLTYRQREVLSHLARGRSNKEIARCLGLLESTVKVHVKTILKKLAATNRTQAAMLAVEMGWARHVDA